MAARCLRSLWETLIAAASTCALFAASNWGTAGVIAYSTEYSTQIVVHALFLLAMPLSPLAFSMWNALQVWMVKSFLNTGEDPDDRASIAIITLCPIYIRAAFTSSDAEQELLGRGYTHVVNEDLCPLELRPNSQVYKTGHSTAALHVEDDSTQWMLLQLPDTSDADRGSHEYAAAERLVLLRLSLAPRSKELSFLRSRNTFQSVVTALQAGGYILSVLQRVVQHRGISPVEAIVSFLSIIVIIQLLIELYACGHYQRPLLLHLDAAQFERFRNAPRQDFPLQKQYCVTTALLLLTWLLISIPAVYYFSHYVHTHLISALSALLFFIAQIIYALIPLLRVYTPQRIINVIKYDRKIDSINIFLLMGSMLLYFCSMIVAVVGTAVEWKAFHNPVPHNWFAWILPHASS